MTIRSNPVRAARRRALSARSISSIAIVSVGNGDGEAVTPSQSLPSLDFRRCVSVTGPGFATDEESPNPLSSVDCDLVTDGSGVSPIEYDPAALGAHAGPQARQQFAGSFGHQPGFVDDHQIETGCMAGPAIRGKGFQHPGRGNDRAGIRRTPDRNIKAARLCDLRRPGCAARLLFLS